MLVLFCHAARSIMFAQNLSGITISWHKSPTALFSFPTDCVRFSDNSGVIFLQMLRNFFHRYCVISLHVISLQMFSDGPTYFMLDTFLGFNLSPFWGARGAPRGLFGLPWPSGRGSGARDGFQTIFRGARHPPGPGSGPMSDPSWRHVAAKSGRLGVMVGYRWRS